MVINSKHSKWVKGTREDLNRENINCITFSAWLIQAGVEKGTFLHLAAWHRGENPCDWCKENHH